MKQNGIEIIPSCHPNPTPSRNYPGNAMLIAIVHCASPKGDFCSTELGNC